MESTRHPGAALPRAARAAAARRQTKSAGATTRVGHSRNRLAMVAAQAADTNSVPKKDTCAKVTRMATRVSA